MNIIFYLQDLQYFFPEFYVTVTILFFILFGVFLTPSYKESSPYVISILLKISVLVLVILLLLLFLQYGETGILLYSRFLINDYITLMKIFLTLFLICFVLMGLTYFYFDSIKSYEFILLLFLSFLGMLIMTSAFDFMIMYLGLELQTICFYILAAYKTNSNSSTEAGIKYFVLGSFSSGLLLFGITIIYGFTGTTNFQDLSYILMDLNTFDLGALVLGLLFILVGVLFKLGSAPFHVWLPDVYEGSPMIVTAFFASITKIPAVVLFINLLYLVFYSFAEYSHILVVFCAVISLLVGGFGALYQTKIKRLVAYSSISHMGFLLLGLSSMTLQGLQATSIYLFIYLLLTINFFSVIIGVRKQVDFSKLKTLDDFRPLFKSNPVTAVVLSLNLFSYAGIPPLAGFLGKFYVLTSATNAGLYFVVFLAIVFSTVSSVYYIRLIKIMFFEKIEKWSIYLPFSFGVSVICGYTTMFNIFLFIYVAPLVLIIQNSIYYLIN